MTLPIVAVLALFAPYGLTLAVWILIAIALAGLVFLYYRIDDRREERRKRALDAAAQCREIGDDALADLLTNYAVGDKTGIAKQFLEMVNNLNDVKGIGIVAMRANLVQKILPKIAEDPMHGPAVRKVVAQVYGSQKKIEKPRPTA